MQNKKYLIWALAIVLVGCLCGVFVFRSVLENPEKSEAKVASQDVDYSTEAEVEAAGLDTVYTAGDKMAEVLHDAVYPLGDGTEGGSPVSAPSAVVDTRGEHHTDGISFFGHKLIYQSVDSVKMQIAAIAKRERNLVYKDNVLSVCGVEWGVNIRGGQIVLLTSHNPEEPKMKKVIRYLTKIYGKPEADGNDEYRLYWYKRPDTFPKVAVQLRRVHGDGSGTFLFFPGI